MTDIFQARLASLFSHIPHVLVYIDKIAITNIYSLIDHLQKLKEALLILLDSGMQVNSCKCTSTAKQIEYLGCISTKEGMKPQKKNTKILEIQRPKSKR